MKRFYTFFISGLLLIISQNVFSQTTANFTSSVQCFGDSTIFTNTSTSTGTLLSAGWDFNNDSVFNDASGNTAKFLFGSADTFLVGLRVVSTIDTDTIFKSIIVQLLVPAFTIGNDSQCLASNSFSFTNSSTITPSGTMSYAWAFGDGNSSILTSPTHSFAGTPNTSYTIKLVATSDLGCMDSVTATATILPNPVVGYSVIDTIRCPNQNFQFTNQSTIPYGSMNYLWDFGDGNQTNTINAIHSYPTTGTYIVLLKATSFAGCIDSVKKTMYVQNTFDAQFTVNNDSQCIAGNSFLFTSTAKSCAAIDSVKWDLDGNGTYNDAKGTLASNTYLTAGSYKIGQVIYAGIQTDTAWHTIVVFPKPAAGFSINNNYQPLIGNYFIFTNSSSITPTSPLTYKWYFGDGSSSVVTNPGYSYSTFGTFQVKLIATSNFGCKDSITQAVTVYTALTADFNADTVCVGDSTTFTSTTISSDPILFINWDFDNNLLFNDGQGSPKKHLFTTPGTFLVGLQVITAVDTDDVYKQVVVKQKPVAGFNINNPTQQLPGNNFIFTNTSTITPTIPLTYLWNFGDAATSAITSPNHSYSAIGTYNVKLIAIANNGCKDSITKTARVTPVISLSANFTADTVCEGLPTNFQNTSTSTDPIIQLNWDLDNDGNFNDGTGSPLLHQFPSYGPYSVGLQVITANDTDVMYKWIVVKQVPVADFMINRVIQPFPGNNFIFTNATLVTPFISLSFNWEFGDGGTANSIDAAHSYAAIGNYPVSLIATASTGCKDTIIKQVQVLPFSLVVDFSIGQSCEGDTTMFTNLSTVTNDTILNYLWDYGDNTPTIVKKDPKHIYETAGNYNVKLTILLLSGNKDSVIKQITVNPRPVFAIDYTPDTMIYQGQTATFTANPSTFDSIIWSTGTKASSIDVTLAGTYTARVYDVNGCSNTAQRTLIILPKDEIQVTTIFSPNGDGVNDYWKILNIGAYGTCKVTIYNRWGDDVFTSSNYQNDWDGTKKGKKLPEGTYYYVIETENDGTFTGPVNIIK
jgi:gliding motility-associated-like protein